MSEHQQETWAGVLLTALMIGRSYWLPGASVTTNATRAPRHALSRLCTLGINAKQPRENGSRTWAMPQWGRRHLRRRDQPPARGFPCPAQTPSPSASRAYSPRPGYIRLGPSLQACHRASLRYASVSALPQGPGALGGTAHWARAARAPAGCAPLECRAASAPRRGTMLAPRGHGPLDLCGGGVLCAPWPAPPQVGLAGQQCHRLRRSRPHVLASHGAGCDTPVPPRRRPLLPLPAGPLSCLGHGLMRPMQAPTIPPQEPSLARLLLAAQIVSVGSAKRL
jgi:hypothetical protein